MKIVVFQLLSAILLSSAQAEMTAAVPNYSTSSYGTLYHIRRGQYYPDSSPNQLFTGSSLTRTVRFDLSAQYTFPKEIASEQADINKLYGFSDCYSEHQTNSARVGWRYFNKKIELHAYVYRKGVRSNALISTILPFERQKLTIKMSGSQYIFYVNGVEKKRMSRGCTYVPFTGYQLYPYFGGTQAAPQEVWIKLQ